MTRYFSNLRMAAAVLCVVFGLVMAGCGNGDDESKSPTAPTPPPPSTIVINDDPNCQLVLRKGNAVLKNEGQVTYVNRVLTTKPLNGLRPVCVQYNDKVTGETTLWKDLANTGVKVATVPRDRPVDKILVWYE